MNKKTAELYVSFTKDHYATLMRALRRARHSTPEGMPEGKALTAMVRAITRAKNYQQQPFTPLQLAHLMAAVEVELSTNKRDKAILNKLVNLLLSLGYELPDPVGVQV